MAELDTTTDSRGLWVHCASPQNLRRAFRTALIVGPILTLINQTDAIASLLSLETVPGATLFRIGLTFLVPFLVSLFSSALADKARYDSGA